VHSKGPAYSFGQRDRLESQKSGPGPGPGKYSADSKLVIHSAPRYTLCGRPKDMPNDTSPDPAAYGNARANPNLAKPPAFSFGLRHRHHVADQVPGPNVYSMPTSAVESNRRRAPSHAIASRNKTGGFHEDLKQTPGPAAYDVTSPKLYMPKPPHYSIAARYDAPGDTTKKPGPGAHHPESVHMHKRSAPKFSFGSRHSQYAVSLIVPVTN
jgi:hypothetical protein